MNTTSGKPDEVTVLEERVRNLLPDHRTVFKLRLHNVMQRYAKRTTTILCTMEGIVNGTAPGYLLQVNGVGDEMPYQEYQCGSVGKVVDKVASLGRISFPNNRKLDQAKRLINLSDRLFHIAPIHGVGGEDYDLCREVAAYLCGRK